MNDVASTRKKLVDVQMKNSEKQSIDIGNLAAVEADNPALADAALWAEQSLEHRGRGTTGGDDAFI